MITTTRHHGPISAGCSPRVAAKGGSQGTRAACIRERYLHQTSNPALARSLSLRAQCT